MTGAAAEAARGALAAGKAALLWRRQVADTETPVAAALRLIEPGRGDFLLESVEGGATRGRHSLIGLAPDLIFRAHGDHAEINRCWAEDRAAFAPASASTVAALRALVAECRADVPAELPRALACLVGYFGYETVTLVERLDQPAADPLELPDMMFVRPSVLLVFDRLADTLFLVAPAWPDPARAPAALVAAAEERLDAVAARLAASAPSVALSVYRAVAGSMKIRWTATSRFASRTATRRAGLKTVRGFGPSGHRGWKRTSFGRGTRKRDAR